MSTLMRTAIEALKAQAFKAVLARLSSANIRQQAGAPVLFDKLEQYAEPYFRAFPKAVNYAIGKAALAVLALPSFFAFFSEAMRQLDLFGRLLPSAYLIGYFALFALSTAAFFFWKAPKIEKRELELVREPEEETHTFANVEAIPRPTPLSGTEMLLNELRAERASFFSPRN